MGRRDILGLIAEFDCLIRDLAQEIAAIDREIGKLTQQAHAISAYGRASRIPSATRSSYRESEKGEVRS